MQPDDERFSEESRKFLLEAKKGKSRKFVLVRDGVQIDRLIIFKKGTFDHIVRKARQEGAWGEMYFGMLQGDGTDIRFELSRADGFTTPPGTEARLKEFLREVSGLKFEPAYVIVDNLVTIEEAEKDGGEDEEGDSESSPVEDSVVTDGGSSVVEEDLEEKFVRLLKAILPHVKRALATNTSVSNELRQSVREAQELGRRREFDPGLDALRRVGDLTKQALAEAETTMPPAPKSDDATDTQPSRRQQWEARLAEVHPRFSAAVAGSAANVDKLQKVMAYAQNEARQQKFVKALVGLDRLERLLNTSG